MPKIDSSVRDRNCLEHMLKYCDQLVEAISEIDSSEERFLKSHTYQNAIAMCILQLGELTKQLSPDFLKEHRSIPWSQIAKTRDMYAHHYGTTDFEMVWDTAINDVPPLREFCLKCLQQKD